MKKVEVEFNRQNFEVEYAVDSEMYEKGICLNSVSLDGVDFYWDFSKGALDEIKCLVWDKENGR